MSRVCSSTGVAVRYGDLVALRDARPAAGPGQLLAVTGPSGAGKSALLWALAGALRPAEGGCGRRRRSRRATGSRRPAWASSLVPQGNGLASS